MGVGLLHLNGVGVLQDSCAAARYFRLAANQGLPNTQLNLGTLY